MILFGTAITNDKQYERCAAPGIALAAEPDSVVLKHPSTDTIFRNYNILLDRARTHDGLEALVLVHQDAEIVDPAFCSVVRSALADGTVAIGGCAGAIGMRNIAWWEGAVTWASFTHRYREYGGGSIDGLSWNGATTPLTAKPGDVESVDGFLLVFSPWAVENLRFDETLGDFHGYDYDICCQARAQGKRVITLDTRAIHHHSLDLIFEPQSWIEANIALMRKWEGTSVEVGDRGADWKERALRAEAEAAAARSLAHGYELRLLAVRANVLRTSASWSWRVTAPARRFKGAFSRQAPPPRGTEP